MAKKKSQTETPMQSMRERKQQECVLCFRPAIEPMTVDGTRISMKDRRVFCRVCGTVLNRSCYFLKTAYSYRVYAVFLLEGLFA